MVEAAPLKRPESGAPQAMGKYAPFARLGNGGMADVFLAVARGPIGFNKLAVVKRLRNPGNELHVSMFLDEARLSARLSHPNIVNTYEVGESDGKFFIAMEYLEGQPLQAVLASRSPAFTETLATFIALQAAKGLHYAHELCDYDGTALGVVHRDMSPHNLFITYAGEVKLLDFGIAKASVNSTETATGVLKGKVRYMAPEQAMEGKVDRRADVYVLGIVLWEMLAQKALYTGDSISILTRLTSENPPLLRTVRADIPPELEAIVGKALRRDQSERYATADAMRIDLERFLRGTAERAFDSALAGLMNEAFAATRDAVRAQVKAHAASLPAHSHDPASMTRLGQSADLLPVLLGGTGAGTGELPSSLSLVSGSRTNPRLKSNPPASAPSARAKSARPFAIGVGVVAIAVIALVTLRRASPSVAVAAASPAVTAPAAPQPTASALVRLETTPPGALVEWNGKPIERTPANFSLEPGPQTLTISLDGYEVEQVALAAEAGKTTTRALVLHAKAPVLPPPVAAEAPRSNAPTRQHPAPHAPAAQPVAATPTPTGASPRAKIRVLDESP